MKDNNNNIPMIYIVPIPETGKDNNDLTNIQAFRQTELLLFSSTGQVIQTTTGYNYKYLDDFNPHLKTYFVFHAKAEQDATIGLFSQKISSFASKPFYEIVMGGGGSNRGVFIRTCGLFCKKVGFTNSANIMDATRFLSFWVSWTKDIIAVGIGEVVGTNAFAQYDNSASPMAVNFIGIASYGSVVLNVKYFNGK